MKKKIKDINEQMLAYGHDESVTFIKHKSLQTGDNVLYDDDVHISQGGGTALFVSDVHRAIGLHNKELTHGNQERPNEYSNFDKRFLQNTRASDRFHSRGKSQSVHTGSSDLNQLCQLMLLNMLKTCQDD